MALVLAEPKILHLRSTRTSPTGVPPLPIVPRQREEQLLGQPGILSWSPSSSFAPLWRENQRRWRGTPEKDVVAADLAPHRCNSHFASWSLSRERGKYGVLLGTSRIRLADNAT